MGFCDIGLDGAEQYSMSAGICEVQLHLLDSLGEGSLQGLLDLAHHLSEPLWLGKCLQICTDIIAMQPHQVGLYLLSVQTLGVDQSGSMLIYSGGTSSPE